MEYFTAKKPKNKKRTKKPPKILAIDNNMNKSYSAEPRKARENAYTVIQFI